MICVSCNKKLNYSEKNICVLCGAIYCNECESQGMLRYSKIASGDICDDNCFLPPSMECKITDELCEELDKILSN